MLSENHDQSFKQDKIFVDEHMQNIPIKIDDYGNMMGGVYRIHCIKNNKSYIGKTNNVRQRLQQHFSLLSNNLHHSKKLQEAYNEFGREAFVSYIIHPVNNASVNLVTEKRYIRYFNTIENGSFNMI